MSTIITQHFYNEMKKNSKCNKLDNYDNCIVCMLYKKIEKIFT